MKTMVSIITGKPRGARRYLSSSWLPAVASSMASCWHSPTVPSQNNAPACRAVHPTLEHEYTTLQPNWKSAREVSDSPSPFRQLRTGQSVAATGFSHGSPCISWLRTLTVVRVFTIVCSFKTISSLVSSCVWWDGSYGAIS
jgi:hypothetical protein